MRFHEIYNNLTLPIYEAPIGIPGLKKYKGTAKDRAPIILQKIKNQESFKVKTAAGIQDVVFDPLEYNRVAAWLQNPTSTFSIKVKDSNVKVPFGALIKTAEFGGEATGKREKIESDQIQQIQQQLTKLLNGQTSINLTVGDRVVSAASVIKTPEFIRGKAPKSDMTVLDAEGKAVAWVSLKGSGAFRWGGWLQLIGDPNIVKWLARIRSQTGMVLEPGQSYGLHVDRELKLKLIYGKDHGAARGISNVDCVLVGKPQILAKKQQYQLTADAVYNNGQVPQGAHDPYLVLRYMRDRHDAGFTNARAETNISGEGRRVQWLDAEVQTRAV